MKIQTGRRRMRAGVRRSGVTSSQHHSFPPPPHPISHPKQQVKDGDLTAGVGSALEGKKGMEVGGEGGRAHATASAS